MQYIAVQFSSLFILVMLYHASFFFSRHYKVQLVSGYCQVIVGKYFIQINYRTASVRYAAKTRCVSYSLHSLIHSGSCANSPCGLRHAPAFVAKAQLPTEASLSSFASYHHPSQFNIKTPLWNEVFHGLLLFLYLF